jgi:hypothetical protein
LGENNREMYLTTEIVDLFIEQISVALKNASQYAIGDQEEF